MPKRQPSGVPVGGQFAAFAQAEAEVTLVDTDDDESALPDVITSGHIAVVTTPSTITGTCTACGEATTVPNKGLGRAVIGAWKTRHQHTTEES